MHQQGYIQSWTLVFLGQKWLQHRIGTASIQAAYIFHNWKYDLRVPACRSLASEKRINFRALYSKLLLFHMEKLFYLLVPLSFLLMHMHFRSQGIYSNPMPSTSLFSWLPPCLEDIYLNIEIQQYRDCTFSVRKCAVSFFFRAHCL